LTSAVIPGTVAAVGITGDRGRDLGAYAAITVGLTVAGCAQAWGGHRQGSWILPSIGVGLAVAAFSMLRTLPAARVKPSRALRVVTVVVTLVATVMGMVLVTPKAEDMALHDRELAGVTIGLPDGEEAPNPGHAAMVSIDHAGGFNTAVAVIWQFGTFDDAFARGIADAAAARMGAKAEPLSDAALVVGSDGLHRSFGIATEAGEMSITVFACGTRIFGVMVGGDGMTGVARRMLATVRCRPPADDGDDRVPAIVEMPAGWQRAASEPRQLRYESGLEQMVVTSMEIVADAQVQSAVEAMARRMGFDARLGARHAVAASEGTHAVWGGTMTDAGVTVAFQIGTWPCPERRIALVAIHLGGDDENKGLALFEHVRCARRDEPATAR